jgi:hypothetical protein
MKLIIATMFGLALTAAAPSPQAEPEFLTPQQAVMGAAASRTGIQGLFVLTVRASGRQGLLYLNSERDYRDPRNLSIDIVPEVERQLGKRLNGPVEQMLRGRRIVVRGTARKTRINFISNGRPSGKYYYQTHLQLNDARNLTLLD